MFENPIDRDKTTDSPGLIPYGHTIGSPAIRPIDRGSIRGRAMSSMMEQTQRELKQLHWGRLNSLKFINSVKLLSDWTWEILDD
jgi:hypothetical protein